MIKYENFEDIKVGDEVAVCSNWGKRICYVTKVTPKRFKIGGTQYEKKDGTEYGSGWSYDYCLHVTDEIRQEIATKELFVKMRNKLSNVRVSQLDYETTKKLYDFMIENQIITED